MNMLLFNCVVGSTAYNLRTPTSDMDYRRVVTPTDMTYFFGLDKFEVGNVVTTKEKDNTDYSVSMFVNLARKCNTVMLEMLFAPRCCMLEVHPLFKRYFVDNREHFLSKNLYHVVKGYAHAEYRRALGETTGTLGTRRKEEVKELGYSPKNASHCVRLLWAAASALREDGFTVAWNGPEKEFLMDLKLGKFTPKEFKEMFNTGMAFLEAAKIKSNLPETVSREYFNTLVTNFYLELFDVKYSDRNF
ncbi:MAG: nucleotidyltransferase domain-containing protein [Methanogenium sp.]